MPGSKLIIGCGYLGRFVAARWRAAGDAVQALTRSESNARALRDLGIEPLLGDVTDVTSLSRLPDVDTILYAVGLDRRAGKSQREVYVDGLANVLARLPRGTGRLIYVSSTSVYGQSQGEWVDETSECVPTTASGKVCLEAEQILRRLRPDAMILRISGLYGPGRLIARIDRLRAKMPLEGNPEAWLNLIHVEDAAAAAAACAVRGRSGETYLASDGRPNRRCDYFKLLARLVGAPEPQFDAATLDVDEMRRLGKRCRNRRLHVDLDILLRYPTIDAGLKSAVGESDLAV